MIRGVFVILVWIVAAWPAAAQEGNIPRTADGRPDLSGIWQAMNSANWNLEAHSATQGAVETLGAIGAVPPGNGVVIGDVIPYKAGAMDEKRDNFISRRTEDPEAKCFLPGLPRATYIPHPFQIFQTDGDILITYQFAGAVRTINMSDHRSAPVNSWMGWSNGHWDGDTLVVEVTGLNANWLDRTGNYYTEDVRVVERYTPMSPNHLTYEATIDDPNVYQRPWTIRMPLYRRMEDNAQLHEFKCVEFAEEMMYGHLRKPTENQENGDANE